MKNIILATRASVLQKNTKPYNETTLTDMSDNSHCYHCWFPESHQKSEWSLKSGRPATGIILYKEKIQSTPSAREHSFLYQFHVRHKIWEAVHRSFICDLSFVVLMAGCCEEFICSGKIIFVVMEELLSLIGLGLELGSLSCQSTYNVQARGCWDIEETYAK